MGIVTTKDKICIQKTEKEIREVIDDFCALSKEELKQKYNIGKDTQDWQLQEAINSAKKSKTPEGGKFSKIAYRPFDIRWTYFDGKARGFIGCPRNSVMKHLIDNDSFSNLALICPRQAGSMGNNQSS